jgi:hypothetical protein
MAGTSGLRNLAILSASLAIVPTACRAHPRAETAFAYGALRAASDALQEYRAVCGVYPATLDPLGRGAAEAPDTRTCVALDVLEQSIVDGVSKQGTVTPHDRYALLYVPSDAVEGGFRRYTLESRWMGTPRSDTSRSFWVSEQGRLRWADGRPAGPSDPEVPGSERAERALHPKPFFEHPARFPTILAALEDAIVRLRHVRPVPWLTISAQGRGGAGATASVSVRWRADSIQVERPIDAARVRARAGVRDAALVTHEGGFFVGAATPAEAARLLDAMFHELGVRPHADEDEYALGGEFLP